MTALHSRLPKTDPNYFDNFEKARKLGVEVVCYNCSFDNSQIKVNKRVKLIN